MSDAVETATKAEGSEPKASRKLPQGFTLKAVETEAAGFKYSVEVPQAESLAAILEAYKADGKNGEEVLRDIWNVANEQNSKQQKGKVRPAVEAATAAGVDLAGDEPQDEEAAKLWNAVQDAVSEHQEKSPGFLIGSPRGGGGKKHESGLTAKQRTEFGTAVAMHMMKTGNPPTKAEMDTIAQELGIDPALLESKAA